MIRLMYITNDVQVARMAEEAGVDRIFVDLETLGKAERQGGMDTVQSKHTVADVERMRSAVTGAKLLVRVNPIHDGSSEEINSVIAAGADIVMLPMYKTPREAEKFISFVGGRAKTMLLLETKEADACLCETLELDGIAGPKTAAAVKKFKKAVNLPEDYKCDCSFWKDILGGIGG